jgi:tetratricopeptide (TPR) repeat protein
VEPAGLAGAGLIICGDPALALVPTVPVRVPREKLRGGMWKNQFNDGLPSANSLFSLRSIARSMKAISLLSLLISVTPLVAQNEAAPAPTAADATPVPEKVELLPNQQAFLNLPEQSRKDFVKHLGEATRMFQQKRIFETLEEVDKAEKIFSDSPEIMNLRGSCYVEMRAFDKALEQFKKAATLSKNNPSINFNIAEVLFVTKEWQKAHDLFLEIMKQLPPENIALGRLVEFKILLCKKKLGLDDEVTILAEKYDFLDDSPYYYYAQAALAYDAKDLIKAEEWLAIAGRIFQDPNVLAPWQDTLVEYGYIKSFYGDESPTE